MKRSAKPVIDAEQQQNIEQRYQAVEVSWDDVQPEDPLGMEIGYRLIPMVDQGQNGELLNRIGGIRKKFAKEMGYLPPVLHIRDNMALKPEAYRILMKGVEKLVEERLIQGVG